MKKSKDVKVIVLEKKTYQFGKIEKVVLETQELEQSVFALMHGVDGCDPRIGTVCRAQ